eukprot:gene5148-5034_t
MYHATLSRNAYTSLCVSPGVGTIGIKAVMVGAPSKTSLDSNTAVEMQGGYNQYIRVIEDQNIQVIETVKEQEALAELITTLGAQGHIALDNLIANVKANYSSIERIHVLGYADPIGEAQVNDRLASVRAQTVREYLKENGLQSTLITSEGRGSNALVVATCGRLAQAEDIACNAPNRRVKVLQEEGKGQGLAPESIQVKRVGKHLHILFTGSLEADLIIEDYYEVNSEGYNGIIGQAENGNFYEYLTQDPNEEGLIGRLEDGSEAVEQALGGMEVSGTGAFMGVALTAFNPLLAGFGLVTTGA